MSKLTEYLKQTGFTVTKGINTNNDWGFGGAIKDIYEKDNISVTIGTAYYRHFKPEKFIRINNPGCIFDEFDTSSNQAKAINIIKDLFISARIKTTNILHIEKRNDGLWHFIGDIYEKELSDKNIKGFASYQEVVDIRNAYGYSEFKTN